MEMVKCAISGCPNYQGKRHREKNIKFLCFPKDPRLCQKWLAVCGSEAEFNFRIARICSEHFTEQDWRLDHLLLNVSADKRRLKPGSIPTQNLTQRNESQVEDVSKRKELVQQAIESYEIAEVMDVSSNFMHAEVGAPLTDKVQRERAKKKAEQSVYLPNDIQRFRQEHLRLQREAVILSKRVRKAEYIVTKMSQFFTKGQIKRLKNPQKNCNWSLEDVSNSISLYTASPTMYQMLRKRKFPLPSPSTLRKWCVMLKLRPGIVISTLKTLTDGDYDERDRLCILAFYEIRLKAPSQSDELSDAGLRPYKFAQVFIVRGLVGEWKHIIYYNFDCMMPALILKDIIQRLRDINFTVVAAVTGVGPRKLTLWRHLKVDEENSSFEVFEGEKVFVFANVPHLIKRIRNQFLETGFILDSTEINVDPLSEMLAIEPEEVPSHHNLTFAHINVEKVGRHNLQTALQLFSQSVAEALRKCVTMGAIFSQNAIECSNFLQMVHEWFSVFNSKFMTREGGHGAMAYGLDLQQQNVVISSMSDVMNSLTIKKGEECFLPFQKGILLNNRSLPRFYEYLKQKHNVAYVITNNLNTDDMEHSFGIRKSHAGIAQKPTPLEMKYRLRAGILINMKMNT